jgi:ribosome-binding protein aMBF1 (putative translation factor)
MPKPRRTTSAREIITRRFYEGRPHRLAEREQTHREMALGMKIRRLREEAGMTQRALARKIGTQPSAISRIEDADYDGHSMSLLQKVADALDMLLLIDFAPRGKPVKRGTRKSADAG